MGGGSASADDLAMRLAGEDPHRAFVFGVYPAGGPRLDGRLASGGMSDDVPRLVACRMVKRALGAADAPDQMAGLSQVSFGTGPFSFSGQVRSPDGALYLSGADKRLLSARRERRPFTTMPDWANARGAS